MYVQVIEQSNVADVKKILQDKNMESSVYVAELMIHINYNTDVNTTTQQHQGTRGDKNNTT